MVHCKFAVAIGQLYWCNRSIRQHVFCTFFRTVGAIRKISVRFGNQTPFVISAGPLARFHFSMVISWSSSNLKEFYYAGDLVSAAKVFQSGAQTDMQKFLLVDLVWNASPNICVSPCFLDGSHDFIFFSQLAFVGWYLVWQGTTCMSVSHSCHKIKKCCCIIRHAYPFSAL